MGRAILALDQSSQVSGYAVFINGQLETYGHFTFKDSDIGARLGKIRNKVIELIDSYNINELVLEDIQLQQNVGSNVATFKILAEVLGVLLELANYYNIKATVILASSWKSKLKFKARQRQQQKAEAQELVNRLYGIKATQDEADAICIGTCYLVSDNLDDSTTFDWSD